MSPRIGNKKKERSFLKISSHTDTRGVSRRILNAPTLELVVRAMRPVVNRECPDLSSISFSLGLTVSGKVFVIGLIQELRWKKESSLICAQFELFVFICHTRLWRIAPIFHHFPVSYRHDSSICSNTFSVPTSSLHSFFPSFQTQGTHNLRL